MVTWKDIVLVNGNYYGMEEKISGKRDGENIYQCDDFFQAVAERFQCQEDDIKTLMFDGLQVPRNVLDEIGYGEESCGVYLDGELQFC